MTSNFLATLKGRGCYSLLLDEKTRFKEVNLPTAHKLMSGWELRCVTSSNSRAHALFIVPHCFPPTSTN